jgi:hypothetical protein
VWHVSDAEIGRHSLALSISTRIALWVLALLLVDRALLTGDAVGASADAT